MFDHESALAVVALQQLIAEWGYRLDFHGGSDVADLCTPDCTYLVGGTTHSGPAAVNAFYAARNERVRALQKDGVRTQRHTISNLRVTFSDADNASATFLLVNYSKEGPAPALDLTGPTIVADCQMDCRREADGEWRIALFDSQPIFIGNDPFLNAAVVSK